MSGSKQEKVVNLDDYMPEREVEDIEDVDLNFGFDGDEDNGDAGDDSRSTRAKKADEGAGKEDPDGEGEGEGEGDKTGDDKDGKSDAKADDDSGKDKAKGEKAKKHMVPKDRLDKVLARNRELEEKLARAEAASAKPGKKDGEKAPAKFDFDAAEDQYQDAVLEGNKTKAREIRAQMRAAERAELATEMDTKTTTTSAADRTRDAILEATTEIERQFPMLDSNSKEYNEAAANEMIELYTGMVAAGKSPLQALDKALNYVVKEYDLIGDEPAPDTKDKNVKDKTAAARKQPPKMPTKEEPKKKAVDPDEIDVGTMSDDEWDALPESTKARLRGDILA